MGRFENDRYIIEAKIPHNIGPGMGWIYVAPDAPIIQEQVFSQGDVLGLELIARKLDGSNGVDPMSDWADNLTEWASMFELYHFYDVRVVESAEGPVAFYTFEEGVDPGLFLTFPG